MKRIKNRLLDRVNRANSTTSAGVADTGHAWEAVNGVWGINSSKLYPVSTPGRGLLLQNIGLADCVIKCTVKTAIESGPCFRAVDQNNFYYVRFYPDNISIEKYTAGVKTILKSTDLGGEILTTNEAVIVLRGGTIRVFVDGILRATASDPLAAAATHSLFTAGVTSTSTNANHNGSTFRTKNAIRVTRLLGRSSAGTNMRLYRLDATYKAVELLFDSGASSLLSDGTCIYADCNLVLPANTLFAVIYRNSGTRYSGSSGTAIDNHDIQAIINQSYNASTDIVVGTTILNNTTEYDVLVRYEPLQHSTKHGLATMWQGDAVEFNNFSIEPLHFYNNLQVSDDFEGADKKYWWVNSHPGQAHSCTLSTTHARTGTKSLRMEVRKTDPDADGSKRSEINVPPVSEQFEEHWYCVSILLPSGGAEDYALDPGSMELITQWHGVPDGGEPWLPSILSLITRNGNYQIHRRWDTNAMSSPPIPVEEIDLGSYLGDKGQWVDWIFHIKWGWLESHNPILEVYKNGVKVLDRNGLPNTTNDLLAPYWKLGIYKWEWKENPSLSSIDKRIVYYDSVLVR